MPEGIAAGRRKPLAVYHGRRYPRSTSVPSARPVVAYTRSYPQPGKRVGGAIKRRLSGTSLRASKPSTLPGGDLWPAPVQTLSRPRSRTLTPVTRKTVRSPLDIPPR